MRASPPSLRVPLHCHPLCEVSLILICNALVGVNPTDNPSSLVYESAVINPSNLWLSPDRIEVLFPYPKSSNALFIILLSYQVTIDPPVRGNFIRVDKTTNHGVRPPLSRPF